MFAVEETHYIASVLCLALFGGLGALDGVYFHLIKYRLHEHRKALTEHLLHATRGLVFVPIAFLFYVVNAGGFLLWTAIALVATDLCLEVWDILVEKEARKDIGGISPAEAVVHVLATGFRMAALAFSLAAKPLSAWSLSSAPLIDQELPLYMKLAGYLMFGSSFIGACSHIVLLRGPGGVWSPDRGPISSIAPRHPSLNS